MKILIVGDIHLSRTLPYRQIGEENSNDRYDFRLKLLSDTIKSYEYVISLGDVVDVPDTVDLQLMYDFVQATKHVTKFFHVLGNHDRRNIPRQKSMFDVLAAMNDTFVTFNECALVDAGNTSLVFVPYYEEEAKIVECVEKALRSTKKVYILGHFNFHDPLMGGKNFNDDWLISVAKRGGHFILGHFHNPSAIKINGLEIGQYVGSLNPIGFKEEQGYCLELDTEKGTLTRVEYSQTELFIETEYRAGNWFKLPKYDASHRVYLKVRYDADKYTREEVKAAVAEVCPYAKTVILIAQSENQLERAESVELEYQTDEEFVRSVAMEKGMDLDKVIEKHRQIRDGFYNV